MTAIASRPRLTEEQRSLVEQNQGLAYHQSHRYLNGPGGAMLRYALGGDDDAHQTALLGLIRAAQGFDPSNGAKFSTYASVSCQRSIQDTMRNGGIVRMPLDSRCSNTPHVVRDFDWETYDACDSDCTDDLDDLTLTRMVILELLEYLTERERQVIELRFGLFDGKPRILEEVGNLLGVTKERIRQLEKKAKEKMYEACSGTL